MFLNDVDCNLVQTEVRCMCLHTDYFLFVSKVLSDLIWRNLELPYVYYHKPIQYDTIRYTTVQYNATQCNTIHYNAIQSNTTQCNTLQFKYNAMQYNTIQ